MTTEFELVGLDGANPLAFLAAVGTLRGATLSFPDRCPRLRWKVSGKWTPEITFDGTLTREDFVHGLHQQLAGMQGHPSLAFADNLTATRAEFRAVCESLRETAGPGNRCGVDFVSSFGSDIVGTDDDPEQMQDTAFRTMSGSGHQDFLAFFRNIVRDTTPAHLLKALFESWRYEDPIANLTTRWDPQEDVRYALRWRNPSKENAARARTGSVLGANRLAIEGLPLFPCVPVGGQLVTTGFRRRRGVGTFFTWPIWDSTLTTDVVRSLLSLKELQEEKPDRSQLVPLGVREVFRSERITVGKYRNFTPSRAV